jgi:hypothetical protein
MSNDVFPIQTIKDGRFVENRIVTALLDSSSLDLNDLARMDFTNQERTQLLQLIGYSISGISCMDCVDNETFDAIEAIERDSNSGSYMSQLEARNKSLREELAEVRSHIAQAASVLFEMHIDDF